MTAAMWLLTYLLHSTVLCGSVLLFRRRLRRMDGAEYVWRTAMLLPIVSATIAQAWSIELWEIGIAGGQPIASSLTETEVGAAAPWTTLGVAKAAAVASLTIGLLLMLRDWAAHTLFVRNLGARTPAEPAVASHVADLLQVPGNRPIVLTSSPGATSPIVLGRREICLPIRTARDLTHGQLRALVAHEVAHIIRGDGLWFAAMACLESVLFVQPLNRLGRRELRHLAELSCDEWAARRISDPMAVAQCLVEVASWSRQPGPATVPAATSSKGLAERVQRLIEPRVSPVRLAVLPCLLVLSLASLTLPGFAQTSPVSGDRSADYMRGYELGRAYAARYGTDPSSAARRDSAAMEAKRKHREDLERRLLAARSQPAQKNR